MNSKQKEYLLQGYDFEYLKLHNIGIGGTSVTEYFYNDTHFVWNSHPVIQSERGIMLFHSLDVIDLSNIPIKLMDIPSSLQFDHCTSLTNIDHLKLLENNKISELSLSHTNIKALPDLSNLKNLYYLWLDGLKDFDLLSILDSNFEGLQEIIISKYMWKENICRALEDKFSCNIHIEGV